MTDVADVKRALARLARREAPRSDWRAGGRELSPAGEPTALDREWAATIREAETVIKDIEQAAKFAAAGGRERLELAVERAERAGKRDLSRRGQNVLATFERFEQACRSDGGRDR